MLRLLNRRDVENPDEVAKELNRIISVINENELHNAAIDEYNDEVKEFNE